MEIQKLKSVLIQIYGQESITVETQFARYNTLMENFTSKFDNRELHFFSTPGRTEIGGNHTDHNHGRVIAGSINLDSIAVAAKNQEDRITVYSEGYKEPFLIDLKNLEIDEKEKGTTTSLIRGIAARLKQQGYHIGGFDACMTSEVLIGSGLSSSASMEVLIGTIFNTFFNNGSIPPEVIAIIGQYAENYIAEINEGACRVHGGGFAGTIQIFLPANRVKKFIDLMDAAFGENSVHVLRIRALGTVHLNKFLT